MTLDEIMYDLSDKASWSHDYCRHYEEWFKSIRHDFITLLEIGIDKGGSHKGWLNYFENAIIAGIDIKDSTKVLEWEFKEHRNRLFIYQGSQDDPVFLESVIRDLKGVNIIIDDASHLSDLTIKSFEILFPMLRSGGLYCIEDLDCAYDRTFNGSPNKSDVTIVTYLMNLVYDINTVERRYPSYQRLRKDIDSLHFYNDLCIIKKK